MKRILPFATTSQGYPPLSNNPNGPAGWDFIQLAVQDSIAAILSHLTQGDSKVYMLAGASITIAGGNYTATSGWVWYSGDAANVGELFYLQSTGGPISMGGHAYLNASIDNVTASASDPLTYIGGGTYSPHVFRKITLAPAAAPSAGAYSAITPSLPYGLITVLPDATLWLALYNPKLLVIGSGVGGAPNYHAGYSAYNQLEVWKDASGLVHIVGDFTCAGTDGSGYLLASNLPANMVPLRNTWGMLMTTGSNYATFKANVAYGFFVDTVGRINMQSLSQPMDAGTYTIQMPPFPVI